MLGCAERIEVNCLFWLIFLYLTLRKNLLSQDILFVYTKVKTHAVKDVHTPSPFPPPHFKISSPRSSISMILPFLGMSCVLFFTYFKPVMRSFSTISAPPYLTTKAVSITVNTRKITLKQLQLFYLFNSISISIIFLSCFFLLC